ncbi:MAG: hypothetical protein O3A95_07305 [Planctomycetota bacterium]|nr:hypothetical protein [Planctomycetota bacterium]MDA1114090.1 hypothetical protein [Planctomycetota bacterium]
MAFFCVIAFSVLLFTLALGLVLLLLSTLGIGPKRSMPKAPFGFPFQPPHGGEPVTSEPPAAKVKADTPKELESFHGSLNEFMQQRKDQDPK